MDELRRQLNRRVICMNLLKYYLGFAVLLFAVGSHAQTLTSIAKSNSLKSMVTLPFRLTDEKKNPISIASFQISSEDCMAMIDPNIKSNLLVKCKKETSLAINVFYQQGDQLKSVSYGPASIGKIADTLLVAIVGDTQGGGGDGGSGDSLADSIAAGRTVWNNSCKRCHDSAASKAKRTVSQLKTALSSQSQMTSIKLTEAQIKSISDYLSNL